MFNFFKKQESNIDNRIVIEITGVRYDNVIKYSSPMIFKTGDTLNITLKREYSISTQSYVGSKTYVDSYIKTFDKPEKVYGLRVFFKKGKGGFVTLSRDQIQRIK